MNKTYFLILSLLALALVSCGDGNNNQPADYGYYGQNATTVGVCSPQEISDWNRLVAGPCLAQNNPTACACGADMFRRRHQGINCSVPVGRGGVSWCPGDWRRMQYFQINEPIIQTGIINQVGWAGGFDQCYGGGYPGHHGGGWGRR